MNPIEYLKDNKDIFNISGIERKLDIPKDTIRHSISGKQKLPDKWIKPLKQFIKNL